MNKLLIGCIATTGLIGFASCSQQDDFAQPSGDGVVFTVTLPRDMATRSTFGDQSMVDIDNLQWTVFEVDGTTLTPVFSDSKSGAFPGTATTETLQLPLAKGKTYQVAFYADKDHNGFVSYNEGKISVAYENLSSNEEDYDAFVGKSDQFTVTGAYNASVTLTRPFAQLNWGSDDLQAKALAEVIKTLTATVSVSSGLYTDMDIVSGETSGEVSSAVVFSAVDFNNLPAQTFPVTKPESDENQTPYALIAMNYLLTGEGTVDCTLEFNNGLSPVQVNAAPVKTNFRTNIYGSLLTAPADFNIIVDNNFDDPDNNLSTTVKEPEQNASGAYLISTEGELKWIAEQVNAGSASSSPNKATYELQNDIYLTEPWTPIGTGFDNRFSGTFNGNGHTIYNMDVTSNERTGFFGMMNGKVSNLNFDNAKVVSNHWAGVVAGYSDNETGSAAIDNCKVSNSSVILSAEKSGSFWDNGDKGGMIIGYMATLDHVTNCIVTNSILQGYRDLGGIIGCSNGSDIRDNKVDGLTILVDNTHNYMGYTNLGTPGNNANDIIGRAMASTTQSGNTSSNVRIAQVVTSQEGLDKAISKVAQGATTDLFLAAGSYTMPDVTNSGATLNLIGTGKDVIMNTSTARNAVKSLNFENMAIQGGKDYQGFQQVEQSTGFTDCVINGHFYGYSPELTFDNCEFNVNANAYAIWTYQATKADFTDCTFTNTKQAKAILVYNENTTYPGIDINITDCSFSAPESTLSRKGVVEIHTENFDGSQKGSVNIQGSTYTGPFTGWVEELNNSTNEPTSNWDVIIR